MEQNGLSWAAYLERCRRYRHALYISEVSQVKTDAETQLNYQFLVTASIQPDEFRPADLPLGWKAAPSEEKWDWKYTSAILNDMPEYSCIDEL